MKFSTLGGLFAHYHEVRASMSGARTNMPDPEALSMETSTSNPMKARDAMEYRKALVGDVLLYFKGMQWCDRYTFMARMRPPGHDPMGWGTIVKRIGIIAAGKRLKSVHKDRNNLHDRYYDVILPKAEEHFIKVGYLKGSVVKSKCLLCDKELTSRGKKFCSDKHRYKYYNAVQINMRRDK